MNPQRWVEKQVVCDVSNENGSSRYSTEVLDKPDQTLYRVGGQVLWGRLPNKQH